MSRRTNVDRILAQMKRGDPWDQIVEEYRSKKQIYQAYSRWRLWADEVIPETQKRIRALRARVRELDSEIASQQDTVNTLNQTLNETADQHGQLLNSLTNLKTDLQEAHDELDQVNTRLADLKQKGVTLETVDRIHQMEIESSEELTERVRTAADHVKIRREVAQLRQVRDHLQDEIKGFQKAKTDLEQQIQMLKKRLDEAKFRVQAHAQAVSVVTKFFFAGYNTRDFERLIQGLGLLRVKDDPNASITKLITGIESAKTLITLNDAITQAETQLATLNSNLDTAKGELDAYQKVVLKTLIEAKDEAILQIQNTSKRGVSETTRLQNAAKSSIEEVAEKWREQLQIVDKSIHASPDTAQTAIDGIVTTLDSRTETAYKKFDANVTKTMDSFTQTAMIAIDKHVTDMNKLVQKTRDECKTSFDTIDSIIETTRRSILEIRDFAGKTGAAVKRLNALAPIFDLLSEARGEPHTVLSILHTICMSTKEWLQRQPQVKYMTFNKALNEFENAITFTMRLGIR